MFHRFADTILVDRSRYVIGGSFYVLFSLPHSHADSSMTEHADVVSPISECHRVIQSDIKITDNFVYALLLGISFGGYIGKGGIPAAYLASWD